jgi:hypothetical protein
MFTAKDYNPNIDSFLLPTTDLEDISVGCGKRNRFATKQALSTLSKWRKECSQMDEKRRIRTQLKVAPKMMLSFFPELDVEEINTVDVDLFRSPPDYEETRLAKFEEDVAIWRGMKEGRTGESLTKKNILSSWDAEEIENRYRVLKAVARTAKFADDVTIHGHAISRNITNEDAASAVLSTDSLSDYCFKCKKLADILVRCDDCGMWYDFQCAGITEAPPEDEQWFCETCEENQFVDDAELEKEEEAGLQELRVLQKLPFNQAKANARKLLEDDDEEAEQVEEDDVDAIEQVKNNTTTTNTTTIVSDLVTKAWLNMVKPDEEDDVDFNRITKEIEAQQGFVTKSLSQAEATTLAKYVDAEESQMKEKKEEKAASKRLKATPTPPIDTSGGVVGENNNNSSSGGGGVITSTVAVSNTTSTSNNAAKRRVTLVKVTDVPPSSIDE